jgi:hypothetical protein
MAGDEIVRAAVICRVCRLVKLLKLFVFTSRKRSINSIINLNQVDNANTWQHSIFEIDRKTSQCFFHYKIHLLFCP